MQYCIDAFAGTVKEFKEYIKQKKLSDFEKRVLSFIPKGSQNPITKRELAELVETSERRVRNTIAHIIEDHKIPIGSSTDQQKGGYFLITTPQDYQLAIRHLEPRAKSILKRYAVLKRLGRRMFGQQATLFEDVS